MIIPYHAEGLPPVITSASDIDVTEVDCAFTMTGFLCRQSVARINANATLQYVTLMSRPLRISVSKLPLPRLC